MSDVQYFIRNGHILKQSLAGGSNANIEVVLLNFLTMASKTSYWYIFAPVFQRKEDRRLFTKPIQQLDTTLLLRVYVLAFDFIAIKVSILTDQPIRL